MSGESDGGAPAPELAPRRVPYLPLWLCWAGVVLVCGCAALAGVLECLLVPVYRGSTVVPVAVLLALVSNIAFPRMGVALVGRLAGAALPFTVWVVVIFVFGVLARPEGDVILPGGSGAEHWVSYGVMLGGALAGTITVVLCAPPPNRIPPRPGPSQRSPRVSGGAGRGSPRPAPPDRR